MPLRHKIKVLYPTRLWDLFSFNLISEFFLKIVSSILALFFKLTTNAALFMDKNASLFAFMAHFRYFKMDIENVDIVAG